MHELSTESPLRRRRTRGAYVFLISLPIGMYWMLNGLLLSTLSAAGLLLVELVVLIGGVAATVMMLRRYLGVSYAELGLKAHKNGIRGLIEDSVVCIVATLSIGWLVFTLTWTLVWPIDWVRTGGSAHSWYDAMAASVGRLPVAFYLATTAALAEEIYFRGIGRIVAFSVVPAGYAPLAYCAVSALWFGLGHWESGLTSMIASTVLGVLFARLYLWTDNLWPLIIAHFIQDFVQLIVS